MAIVSSIFWILGLTLAVLLGPQLRIWTWGPAMACTALAALFALPAIWNGRNGRGDTALLTGGTILTLWFAARAYFTPVSEAAQADLLLLSMAVATFVTFRAIGESANAQRVLIAGIALLTAASLAVIAKQLQQPGYSPVFHEVRSDLPAGFFGHYSYGGSFLIAVSFLLGGISLHSKSNAFFRAALGLIALLGIAGIYYSRSRGAIIGAAGGFAILALCTLIIGKRDDRKWFVPALLLAPIVAGGIIYGLLHGWSGAQEARNGTADITAMLDNEARWHLAGIAISCIMLHPMLGGGARSYSWESFRFWDTDAMGLGQLQPGHVHNELLQAASDYGIIGAVLLVIFLTAVAISVLLRSAAKIAPKETSHADGWRIGGFAGLAGLFTQSNFEGIFRIAPGAILLALCIAAACHRGRVEKAPARAGTRFGPSLLLLVAVTTAVPLLFAGIRGTKVCRILWPVYFGTNEIGNEARIDAHTAAIGLWPLHSLIMQRGIAYQDMSSAEGEKSVRNEMLGLALSDYRRVSELHRFDPQPVVGSANILSALGRNDEAEAAFSAAISLQGGMEAAFHAHFRSAKHYHRKAVLSHDPANPAASLADMEIAIRHMEEAADTSLVTNREDQALRVQMHQDYGMILESVQDYKAAMRQYDFASELRHGRSSHYYAAQLLGRLAAKTWTARRSEDALFLFMQASERLKAAGNGLPDKVTRKKRNEYAYYLRNTINYLEGAKVIPSKAVDF